MNNQTLDLAKDKKSNLGDTLNETFHIAWDNEKVSDNLWCLIAKKKQSSILS